ncbi:MAG: hypothetical protein WCO63_10885 [Bacteroidota bacterium]
MLPVASFCFGQSQGKSTVIKPDPRLYDCLDKSYVDGLKDNPRLLLYYNFFLDNSYYISATPEKKVTGADISTLALRNPGPNGEKLFFSENLSTIKTGSFNPLKYDISLQPNMFTNYYLGQTGKVLVFYSNKEFTEKYRIYLKSFNLDLVK